MMNRITDAVKHLIIVNVIIFFITYYVVDTSVMMKYFALYSTESPLFKGWQLISAIFMHGGFMHIIFNMFTLYVFGSALESFWGTKKFVAFYFLTGIGAAAVYLFIKYLQIQFVIGDYNIQETELILTQGVDAVLNNQNFVDNHLGKLNVLINGATIGASGATVGLLMAFGFLFPNAEFTFPFPIKAKYYIPLLIIYEMSMEFADFSWDNVAHLGHLSGLGIAYIIMKNWNKHEFNRWN